MHTRRCPKPAQSSRILSSKLPGLTRTRVYFPYHAQVTIPGVRGTTKLSSPLARRAPFVVPVFDVFLGLETTATHPVLLHLLDRLNCAVGFHSSCESARTDCCDNTGRLPLTPVRARAGRSFRRFRANLLAKGTHTELPAEFTISSNCATFTVALLTQGIRLLLTM